jgi:hypothetical protein
LLVLVPLIGTGMRTFLYLLLVVPALSVRAEIYECIDENGNKRFTNVKAEAKGCKPMNLGPPNTVSAPKPAAKTAPAASVPTPAGFPKVAPQTQQSRDHDRRRILEQELGNEQKLLDQAKKELTEQESIRLGSERNYQRVLDRLEPYRKKVKLHEDNIANLRKELSGIR